MSDNAVAELDSESGLANVNPPVVAGKNKIGFETTIVEVSEGLNEPVISSNLSAGSEMGPSSPNVESGKILDSESNSPTELTSHSLIGATGVGASMVSRDGASVIVRLEDAEHRFVDGFVYSKHDFDSQQEAYERKLDAFKQDANAVMAEKDAENRSMLNMIGTLTIAKQRAEDVVARNC